jgi:hypothetical protein
MRFRPANISLINRRHYLPRLLLTLSSKRQIQKPHQRFEDVDRVTPYQGRVARHPPVIRGCVSVRGDRFRYADLSVLISQACLSRHLSEMMDRIAKGPEDVKKSVRAADELP